MTDTRPTDFVTTISEEGELLMNRSRIVVTWALVVLAIVGVSSVVFGHAHIESSEPEADAVVHTPPDKVVLKFTEPVELGLSVFKVYPLPPADSADQLKGEAANLVGKVLLLRGDEAERADRGVVGDFRQSADVEILLRESLQPGSYVVMWRVVSVDTHATQGHFVFTYTDR